MALVGMLGHGDICSKKVAMEKPQKEKQMAEECADGAESTANTTAPATPLSVPTSSPSLMPLSRSVSDESSCQLQPLMEASVVLKFPAGHGSGDMYRFRDRHGAMRYTTAGYATDCTTQEHSCHGTAGVGGGTCLDGERRIPCRRYGRDGRMVYRH